MQTRSSRLLNWITRIQNHSKSNVKKIGNKVGQIQFNKFKCQPREKWITRITLSKKTIVSPQLNNRQRLNIELLRLNFSECYRGKPFVFIDRLYLKRVELLQLRNGTILLNDHLLGRNKGPFLYGDLDKCLRYISKEHYKYVFIGRKRYVKR